MARQRFRWYALAAAAAASALLVPAAIASAGQVHGTAAPHSLLWAGNPAAGPAANFQGLEESPGSITVANDPQGTYGSSFRYETWDWSNGKERCESRGIKVSG